MPHILDYDPQLGANELPFEDELMVKLKKMPKVDLHRHLVGSIRPEVLVYIADKLGILIPIFGNDSERIRKASVVTTPKQDGYKHFLAKRIWSVFQHIFSTRSGVANAIYWAAIDAGRDGVCYVEFRVSPYGVDRTFPLNLHSFVAALRDGIEAASRDYPQLIVKIIFSIGRRSVFEKWDNSRHRQYYDRLITIAKAFDDVVVGFDISGDEEKYPNKLFIDFAERVKANNFKLTVHAGETGSASSMWEAIKLLQVDRIGHGIGAKANDRLMETLSEKKITLELCPTSNLLLGVVPDLESYPCRDFLARGIEVTINTDDPVLLGPTNLSKEFYRLIGAKQIMINDIERISNFGINASFATEREKAQLTLRVKDFFLSKYSRAATNNHHS
jgi:adenosine deaminase